MSPLYYDRKGFRSSTKAPWASVGAGRAEGMALRPAIAGARPSQHGLGQHHHRREGAPGTAASAETIGQPSPRLLVEERAIGTDQRGDYLLVVNDKNVVEYRPVHLGIEVGGFRVVEQGVGDQDRVVINGLQRARPGSEVRPEMAEMAAEAQSSAADQNAPPPVTSPKRVPEQRSAAPPPQQE